MQIWCRKYRKMVVISWKWSLCLLLCWFASCTRDLIGFLKLDKSMISCKNSESWFQKIFRLRRAFFHEPIICSYIQASHYKVRRCATHAITHLITFWCVTNHAPRLVVETLKKETVNKRVPKQNHEGFDDTTTYLLYFLWRKFAFLLKMKMKQK